MSFKRSHLTPQGKLALAAAIIVFAILAYLLLFCPPRAEAIKTKVVELFEEGQPADGKVKFYRTANETLIVYTNGSTISVKDGHITMSGKILTGQQSQLANLVFNNFTITSPDGNLTLKSADNFNIYIDYDDSGTHHLAIISQGSGYVFTVDEEGHTDIKGGLNLGTATGAGVGDGKFSGIVTADTDAFPVAIGYNKVAVSGTSLRFCTTGSGDIDFRFYEKLSSTRTGDAKVTAYGSAADSWGNYIQMTHTGDSGHGIISTDVGKILLDPQSGEAEVDGNFSADSLHSTIVKLPTHTAALPTASEAYVGQFYLKRDAAGIVPDKLYICLRELDSLGYHWVLVASGP